MIFESWQGVGRVILVGVLAYVALIAILRISGSRTLSKMNAFDLVVTVALGSTLATILLSKDVALVEGIVAFIVLIGLQFIVTALSVRSNTISDLVKSEPRLMLYQGNLLHGELKQARVVEDEVMSAIRQLKIAQLLGQRVTRGESDHVGGPQSLVVPPRLTTRLSRTNFRFIAGKGGRRPNLSWVRIVSSRQIAW